MRTHAIVAAMFLAPAITQAASWNSGFDRGITYHVLKEGALELTLACDPNGAYDPPQDYLVVSMEGRFVDGPATFEGQGKNVTIAFQQGNGLKRQMEEGAWNKLLTIISSPEGFSFMHNNESVKVTLANQLQHDCK